jgi:hypothetical protein
MELVSELEGLLLKRGTLREAFPILLLLVFFVFLFVQLLSTHMLAQKADGLYSGGSTWGDLAWHLSMISNFAQRGSAAVRENPIFPGSRLSYPFVPDLISALLVRRGINLQASSDSAFTAEHSGIYRRTLPSCPQCWRQRARFGFLSLFGSVQRQYRGNVLSVERLPQRGERAVANDCPA